MTVQELEPVRFAVPQVSAVISKSVEFESAGAEQPLAVLFPRLVRVNSWVADGEPVFTFP